MKQMSFNCYELQSRLEPETIVADLSRLTLKQGYLIMVRTRKDFIGKVGATDFAIIDSWFPIGVACVVKGRVQAGDQTEVKLTTRLHVAFRILFGIWGVAIFTMMVIGILTANQGFSVSSIGQIFLFLIVMLLFRLFLHGVYLVERNHVIKKLKRVML